MKHGDLVRKRWGKIEPEEQGVTGLLIKVKKPSASDWRAMVTVLYHFGERVFAEDDVEVVNENR